MHAAFTALVAAAFTAVPVATAPLPAQTPDQTPAQPTARLSLQDLLSPDPIGETSLSPDGATIATVRSGQIVLLPATGGWPITLTSQPGAKSGLAWSPDGKRLAFIHQGSVWIVPIATGTPLRLTDSPASSTGDPRQAADRDPQWSPDGRWILYTSGRRGTNSLFVTSADGRTSTLLTPDRAESNTDGRWSPDGHHIVFLSRAPQFFSGRLVLLPFNSGTGQAGEPRILFTSPVDRGGGWSIHGTTWAPDGKSLLTVLQLAGWDHLYALSLGGGDPRQLTFGDADDEEPTPSPDGQHLAFTSNRPVPNLPSPPESTGLWSLPLSGGPVQPVTPFPSPGVTTDPQWSPDSRTLFLHHQSPVTSTDLFSTTLSSNSAPAALTHTTPQPLAAAARPPLRVTWKSKDGREIAGLLYTPPNPVAPQQKRPAILWIHGGPEAQDTLHLDAWAQFLAQNGYLVLEPNYRGSTGYSQPFRNLNVEDSGGGEVDDVATGAQFLVSNFNADPSHLGIGGGSHGGTMVAFAVTRYPELFAAAIELFGVVDRTLFIERTNPQSAIRWSMKMGGSPAEKPEVYRRADVLLSVAAIRTPLLVMHGEDDPQVPPAESAAFVRELRAEHKQVWYFTYPHELHGFTQPAHRLDAWARELTFLNHFLTSASGTTSTSTEEIPFPDASSEGKPNAGPPK